RVTLIPSGTNCCGSNTQVGVSPLVSHRSRVQGSLSSQTPQAVPPSVAPEPEEPPLLEPAAPPAACSSPALSSSKSNVKEHAPSATHEASATPTRRSGAPS